MIISDVREIQIPEGSVRRILRGREKLWDRLPDDYQEVEYIESNEGEYIDIGIKGTENTRVDITFQVTSSRFLPFGARQSPTANAFAIWSLNVNVGSNLRMGFDNTAGYTGPETTSDKYHIILDKEGAFVNDIKVWMPDNYRPFETPDTLLVFGYRSSSTSMAFCAMKLFALKLWENNILIRDFIPCYHKSDGEIGMYDTVSRTFYTNAGTGTFTKGADV